MTLEKEEKIRLLSAQVTMREQQLNAIGMTNTTNKTPAERVVQSQEYHLAKARYWEAVTDLEREMYEGMNV